MSSETCWNIQRWDRDAVCRRRGSDSTRAWQTLSVAGYGFNFQWIYGEDAAGPRPADERALDFMAEQGFDFVRIPANYRAWTRDFDYLRPNVAVFESLDGYLEACRARDIHMSLNLHRAPGYCINRNDLEKHNLWLDAVAQDAFVFLWETFARRYAGISDRSLSFDLVNEPPPLEMYGFTRDNHAALIRRTVEAIRAIDPDRPIVIDGLDGGNLAMPELADIGAIHSARGYEPYAVSHWGAEWWDGWKAGDEPRYPGVLFDGRRWGPAELRDVYEPWRAVERMGARIHIGEFGCYRRTPNDVALRWFTDLFGLFREFGWGYALWQFEGPFVSSGTVGPVRVSSGVPGSTSISTCLT